MSKIEVTDAAVDRLAAWIDELLEQTNPGPQRPLLVNREHVRRRLDAVLNPPAEPEIQVSEGMKRAFWDAMEVGVHQAAKDGPERFYRAMEAKRRDEMKSSSMSIEMGDEVHHHKRSHDGNHFSVWSHRRKDDPK